MWAVCGSSLRSLTSSEHDGDQLGALLCAYFLSSDFTCQGLRDRWHILVE